MHLLEGGLGGHVASLEVRCHLGGDTLAKLEKQTPVAIEVDIRKGSSGVVRESGRFGLREAVCSHLWNRERL